MKEILQQYAAYHLWANDRIFEVLLTLPEDYIDNQIPSSFTSIRATLLHIWNAENVWMQRVKQSENVIALKHLQNLSLNEIYSGMQQQSKQWHNWILETEEVELNKIMYYQNSKKEPFSQPLFQIVLHVFNHATYHRGQLVNMLRQLGTEKIPATDFIVWSRK